MLIVLLKRDEVYPKSEENPLADSPFCLKHTFSNCALKFHIHVRGKKHENVIYVPVRRAKLKMCLRALLKNCWKHSATMCGVLS